MDLKYTARIINEVEVQTHQSFRQVIAEPSMLNLTIMVQKGAGIDRTAAEQTIQDYCVTSDFDHCWIEVYKALQAAGFLDKDTDFLAKMEQGKAQVAKL